jgi:hypothetical protein
VKPARASLFAAVALIAGACGSGPPDLAIRAYSDHYAYRISSEPVPPLSMERTRFKVVVNDKKTGQPISGGEGIIYGETKDGLRTWDSFTPAPQLGTYYANLTFIIASNWAMGLRFRPDSAHRLEQVDWMQEVMADTAKAP